MFSLISLVDYSLLCYIVYYSIHAQGCCAYQLRLYMDVQGKLFAHYLLILGMGTNLITK